MGDWSKLQHDLLELIALQHLTRLEDYVAFGAVCTSWCAAAAERKNFKGLELWQQVPCLMLAESEDKSDDNHGKDQFDRERNRGKDQPTKTQG